MKEENGARLLPLGEIEGKEYVIDVNQRQLRRWDMPGKTVPMHSPEGRQLIQAMGDWRCFVLDTSSTAEG